MGRIRLVWSRIWSHIGAHFTHVGLSSDKKVGEMVENGKNIGCLGSFLVPLFFFFPLVGHVCG